MERLFDWMETVLNPWADRLSQNTYMVAFQNTFFRLLPFILTLTIISVIRNVLEPAGIVMGPDGLNLGEVLSGGLTGEEYRRSEFVAFLQGASRFLSIGNGVLSVYLTVALSRQLAELWGCDPGVAVFCSLLGFSILGVQSEAVDDAAVLATVSNELILVFFAAILGTRCYSWLSGRNCFRLSVPETMPSQVARYMELLPAVILTTLMFIVLTGICRVVLPGYGDEFWQWLASSALAREMDGVLLMLLYQTGRSVFWWLGLNGDILLSPLYAAAYIPAQIANQTGEGAYIFTRVFVIAQSIHLWGLAIAILVFSRWEAKRQVVKFCMPALFFNISEPLVFGLPVMFNPILLMPFLIAPLANTIVGWLAIGSGIVPLFKYDLPWVAPPFVGGVLSTGSLMGGVLQAVWLIMDIFIYAPFVIVANMVKSREAKRGDDT